MFIYLYNSISMPIYNILIKNKKWFISLSCIQMFILLAFRNSSVGADYGTYANAFQYIAAISHFSDLLKRLDFLGYASLIQPYKMESGWVLLNWVIASFGLSFRFVMIVYAAFVMTSVGYFIYRCSYKPWLSLFLFATLGLYEFAFICVRQYMAMAILLWAYIFLEEKKYIKVIITFLIAYSFHHTAIIFIGVLCLFKVKVSKQKISLCLLAIAATACAFLYLDLYSLLIYPFISRLSYTFCLDMEFRMNGMFIFLFAIGILMRFYGKKVFWETDVNGHLFWGYGIALLVETIGLGNDTVARGIYVVLLYLVCLLPNVYYYYQRASGEKGIYSSVSSRNAKILTISTVVFMMIFLIYQLHGSVMLPYRFSIG